MKTLDSPTALANGLIDLFPLFAAEFENEEVVSYHQVILRLTPMITGYLQAAPKQTVDAFCSLVNEMVSAGGVKENAISTCLLEHTSQVQVRNIIRPYLSVAAKHELR